MIRAISLPPHHNSVITGKKRSKAWKRMVTKVTFVGDSFTRLVRKLYCSRYRPHSTLAARAAAQLICIDCAIQRNARRRKAPKYERFIRPAALRFKKAHVTHPELAATFHLEIIGVKKNPSSALCTS